MIKNIAYFDLETTGLNLKNDRIVSIYCENSHTNWTMNCLVDPGMSIPLEASMIHGITDVEVKDKISQRDAASALAEILNESKYICGYNILGFDVPLLMNYCKHEGINLVLLGKKYIDLLFICKRIIKGLPDYKLSTVYHHLFNDVFNAHDAEADVLATKRILKWVNKNYNLKDYILSDMYLKNVPCDSNYIFYHGKHQDKSVKEILDIDPGYLKFMSDRGYSLFTNDVLNDIKAKMCKGSN